MSVSEVPTVGRKLLSARDLQNKKEKRLKLLQDRLEKFESAQMAQESRAKIQDRLIREGAASREAKLAQIVAEATPRSSWLDAGYDVQSRIKPSRARKKSGTAGDRVPNILLGHLQDAAKGLLVDPTIETPSPLAPLLGNDGKASSTGGAWHYFHTLFRNQIVVLNFWGTSKRDSAVPVDI